MRTAFDVNREPSILYVVIWNNSKYLILLRLTQKIMATQTNKTKSVEQFKTALKRYSLKATPQRLAVHQAMLKLGHASADMVSEEIQQSSDVKVTVASVYNILTQLALLGIYRHRLSANNKMYFDVNTSRHIHLYDCENHTYRDIFDDELMSVIEAHLGKKKFRGLKIDDIDIQIVGHPTKKKYPGLH